MGSLFGSTTNPQPSTPITGQKTQGNFFNALYGLGLTVNPADGTMMFNSMPSYQGQLTPDLSKMMASNVWNSWSPQGPGMAETQSALQGIQGQIGQASPFLSQYTQGSNPLAAYMSGGQVSFPLPQQVPAPQGARPGMAQLIGGNSNLKPIGPKQGAFN